MESYIVDFVCLTQNLVIELDGVSILKIDIMIMYELSIYKNTDLEF